MVCDHSSLSRNTGDKFLSDESDYKPNNQSKVNTLKVFLLIFTLERTRSTLD